MTSPRLRVGIIGAGPVTQAIHLPTLARLDDEFAVVHIADVSPTIAASVAERVGARWSSSPDELLADAAVDLVAICSPHKFHAAQVIAACNAGKMGILCEKPFAVDTAEAQLMAAAIDRTGVPIVVGSMHTYDPGWVAATENWGDLSQSAHSIRSSVVLPPNSRFEDAATEILSRPNDIHMDQRDSVVQAEQVVAGVLGLAVHDLPLVRRFVPNAGQFEVVSAAFRQPFGYDIHLVADGRLIDLHAIMNETAVPRWRLEAYSDSMALTVSFTPSYVQAGSATAEISTESSTRVFGPYPRNGYEEEWRELASLVRGGTPLRPVTSLIDDLRFTLDIAAEASKRLLADTEGEAA